MQPDADSLRQWPTFSQSGAQQWSSHTLSRLSYTTASAQCQDVLRCFTPEPPAEPILAPLTITNMYTEQQGFNPDTHRRKHHCITNDCLLSQIYTEALSINGCGSPWQQLYLNMKFSASLPSSCWDRQTVHFDLVF